MELFLSRVVYSNLDDKKVTETYLVDALSYTEAEAKVLDYLASFASDAVEIKSLKPLGVSEAIGLDVDGWEGQDDRSQGAYQRALRNGCLQYDFRQLGERGHLGASAGCGNRNQIDYERCTNHRRRRTRPRLNFFLPGLVLPQVYRQALFVGRRPACGIGNHAGKSQSLITTVFNQKGYE